MGSPEIEAFLSHLTKESNVSASKKNQAFNALLFLYRNLLQVEPLKAQIAYTSKILSACLPKLDMDDS